MKRAILHGLAAVALVAATLAIWHWRFVATPGVLPETRLANPLVGWFSLPHQQHQVIDEGGTPVLRLQRGRPGEKSPAIQIWLGPLEGVRFIHVRCESRMQEVELGPEPWSHARFVVSLKDRTGKIRHPPDSRIFAGSGTSGWTKSEAIVELTGDMADTQLSLGMYGRRGILEVRHLSLTGIKQRSWAPFATTLLVLGWLSFCASLVRHHPDTIPGRAASADTASKRHRPASPRASHI